ncbi:MAG: hypothetical protein JNJ54_15535 [Myxococcaceae bacterium]|nr:hypothetical protein [Myxococcaceae bacterium]
MRLADSSALLLGVLLGAGVPTSVLAADVQVAPDPVPSRDVDVSPPSELGSATDAPTASQPGSATTPADTPTATVLVSAPPPASRSARLLAEGAVGVGLGVATPFALYAGFTAMQSFVGFFAGFLSATVVGVVLAPIGVLVAGRLLGAEGGVGRGVVGALLGLLAGLLIGLPLATLPGAGFLVGLGLLWALPAAGTLIAFEWGRAPPANPGLVVLRF